MRALWTPSPGPYFESRIADQLLRQGLEKLVGQTEIEKTAGVYAVGDGGVYSGATAGLRDYGPREFRTNFSGLWIYGAVNAAGLHGPVLTFADTDFGLAHALDCAADHLESAKIGQALILSLFLHAVAEDPPDFVFGWVTRSHDDLRSLSLRLLAMENSRRRFHFLTDFAGISL